jgi:thiosulfate/3-mercaptopyruvate sulfurtransferase
MSRLGVGAGTGVVCYDTDMNRWAAWVWWLLRAFGFEQAAVLNGGWRKWMLEGRPVSTDPPRYPPTSFQPRLRPERIASTAEVRATIDQGSTCLVNALMPAEFRGDAPSPYGRPGRTSHPPAARVTSSTKQMTHADLSAVLCGRMGV